MGAVKTNIGHLEAAAGIAGLIKTVLVLRNGIIPSNLHFSKLNQYIKLDTSNLTIPNKTEKWEEFNRKKIAGVSSFGFGGTNAHIILEEGASSIIDDEKTFNNLQNIICLSAENKSNVKLLVNEYLNLLDQNKKTDIKNICFTANNYRKHFNHRVSIIAENSVQLRDRLSKYINSEFDYNIFEMPDNPITNSSLGMLFTGQGSQYHLMAKELYETVPSFRVLMDNCFEVSDKITSQPLKEIILNPEFDETLINETEFTQPALFIIEYSIAKLMIEWGIKPNFLLGHSIGEYAAACIAEVFNLQDGIKLTVARGKLMQSLPKDGMMASIFSEKEIIEQVIKSNQFDISIAANNGKNNIVISGNKIEVQKLLSIFDTEKVEYKILKVSHAFHSSLMDPILDEFEQIASTVIFKKPAIPIISNLTGKIIDEVQDQKYWKNHLRNTVEFEGSIKTLLNNNCNLFIEIGPNPVLTSMAKRIKNDNSLLWFETIKKNTNDLENILICIANLYVNGININWRDFYKDFNYRSVQIPNYQFSRERYYVEQKSALGQVTFQNKMKLKFIVLNEENNKRKIKVVDQNNKVLFEQDNIEIKNVSTIEEFNKYGLSEIVFRNEADTKIVNEDKIKLDEIKLLSKEEKLNFVCEQLKINLAKVLKLNPNKIKLEKPITLFGLDSIMSIELKNTIEQNFNLNIPIVDLIKGPSLLELSEIIINKIENIESDFIQLEKNKNITEYDLSFGQNALWFQHQMSPKSIFNPTYAVKILNELNIKKFEKVISKIVHRHSVLRSNYKYKNSKPVQYLSQVSDQILKIINCSEFDEESIFRKVNYDALNDFEIENGNVLRINLYLLNNYSILLISAHHIAVDFWSLATIVSEILLFYNQGDEFDLPEMQYNYIDFVIWQKKMIESLKGKKILDYWKNKLDGEIPILELPTIQRRKPIQTFDGNSVSFLIPKDKSELLKDLAEQNNSTLFMVILSLFKILLNKYTHQNDIIVGTPTSGRSIKEFENIVGYFVNPLPVRTQFNNSTEFQSLLASVKQNVLEVIENQDYPFNLIVEKIQPQRNPSRTPIFQVMFVYQKAHVLDDEGLSSFAIGGDKLQLKLNGLTFENYRVDEKKSIFDMTLLAAETDLGIRASLVYNCDLFDDKYIKRFIDHFNKIIEQVLSRPKIKLSQIKLIDEFEEKIKKNEIEEQQNLDYLLVHKAFEEKVLNSPNKIAVKFKNEGITYLELNLESNKIANYLLSKKLKAETKIGVFVERSFAMIKSILGILKAGYVYVPIDTIYPEERILNIIADADIKIIISQEKYCDKLENKNLEIICIDKYETINTYSDQNPIVEIYSSNLAYSIYTSGSTGIPKGVLLTHFGLINLVKNQTKIFNIHQNSIILQFASLSFDASVSEIFTSLINGATLQLISNDVLLSGSSLINELNEKEVSVATIPPSLLAVIPYDKLVYLKTLVSAGELCTNDIVKKWSNGRKFINAYGPTEITVCATTYEINGPSNSDSIPIGNSMDGVKSFIFDQDLNLVPREVIGELYIGGVGLARGYNKLPDLTAEKFIPNPYSNFPGERLYKTGDLVKLKDDGNLEFFGRIDDQIKFRGFRIELKEIKTVLENHGNIKKSEIILKKLPNNEKRLIAFYISVDNEEITKSELRGYLVEHLPDYMIPSTFVRLDDIPLTTNGKVNKKFLEGYKLDEINNSFFESPQSEFENDLINIWLNVLQLEKIGRNDNFFDLGGHSLNVIQVQSLINEKFGSEISVVDFFKYPTVKLLSEFLQNGNQLNLTEEKINGRVNLQKQKLLLNQARMKKGKFK